MQVIAILLFVGGILFIRPYLSANHKSLANHNSMIGEGTKADPYQVTDCDKLQDIRLHLDAHYVLVNDIDCSASAFWTNWEHGDGFSPIGKYEGSQAAPFSGTLDGKGHTIDGLYIDQSSNSYSEYGHTGLFAEIVSSARLLNFKVTNATIIGNNVSPNNYRATGGIVGQIGGLENNPVVSQVEFSGSITVPCSDDYHAIGGLVGEALGSFRINMSNSSGSITAAGSNCGQFRHIAGGLVGVQNTTGGDFAARILNSHSEMDITFNGQGQQDCFNSRECRVAGGLVGANHNNTLVIRNSYAAGSITITGDSDIYLTYSVGGLIGYLTTSIEELSSTFNITAISVPDTCETLLCHNLDRATGGIVGNDTENHYFETLGTVVSNLFDQTVAGGSNIPCVGNDPTNNRCQPVNTDGNEGDYFEDGNFVEPIMNWDSTTWLQGPGLGLPSLTDKNLYPDQPVSVQTTILSASQINLNWSPAPDQFTEYELLCRKTGSNASWVICGTPDSGSASGTLSSLQPATQYDIKIVATTSYEYYIVSDTVTATTGTPGFNLISSCTDLQNMNDDLASNYELAKNIDCSDTINWNNGEGFEPIGVFDPSNQVFIAFTGIFAGNNYIISNLYCDRASMCALIEFAGDAIIQDITLQSPSNSSGFLASSVVDILANSTVTNTHVRDANIGGSPVVAGLFAGATTMFSNDSPGVTFTKNSVTGSMSLESGAATLGGFIGGATGPDGFINNYANVSITAPAATQTGGFVGYANATETYQNNYAAGDILFTSSDPDANQGTPFNPNFPTSLSVVGGFGGVLADETPIDARYNFAHMSISSVSPENVPGGFVGGTVPNDYDYPDNYFDADVAGLATCAAAAQPSCNAITGQPNYFKNNSTNAPLDQWDFTNIWMTTSEFPVFNVASTGTLTPIPPERLNPSNPGTGGNGSGSTDEVNPLGEDGGQAAVGTGSVSKSQTTPSDETGVLGAIKKFVRSLPAGVVVAFPYALFTLLGLAALVLLIELIRELRRLHALQILIHKQQLLAEERDAFWHLAANYLRAPITLIVGGAEALHDAGATAVTTDLKAIAASLQAKVAGIMKKIEGSTSLQAISNVHPRKVTQIARRAVFLVPVITIGILVLLSNYAAASWRNMSPGLLGYVAQLSGFILVTIVFYWVLSLLTQGKGRRQAAEAQLARQTEELANARHELITDTASQLNPDLKVLEGTMKQLSPQQAALEPTKTLQEGSSRLREIVNSFVMLIKIQEGTGAVSATPGASTVDLGNILTRTRAKLTPQVTAKGVRIVAPTTPLPVHAEAELANQVLESIISNAVDYSPANGTVKVEAQRLQDAIQVRVSDQGKGISKKQLDHLFQPFVRTDGTSAMDMSHGGFGINLYIDKLIMEQLGGSISATSTEGQGTAITMTWPTS